MLRHCCVSLVLEISKSLTFEHTAIQTGSVALLLWPSLRSCCGGSLCAVIPSVGTAWVPACTRSARGLGVLALGSSDAEASAVAQDTGTLWNSLEGAGWVLRSVARGPGAA